MPATFCAIILADLFSRLESRSLPQIQPPQVSPTPAFAIDLSSHNRELPLENSLLRHQLFFLKCHARKPRLARRERPALLFFGGSPEMPVATD